MSTEKPQHLYNRINVRLAALFHIEEVEVNG